MSEHDLEKLLGGFAADTLTQEEKQALYTAALQDQQLFNALADEQAFKELLTSPDVRRRLLASLEQKRASSSLASPSWLEWFRRPAGLALAGGLSAAALAVALGVRIYQDSLRHAAESAATENAKPAAPSAPMPPASLPTTPQPLEPQSKSKENLSPAIDRQKKDTSINRPAKQERLMSPPPKREQDSGVARDSLTQRSRQDEVRSQADAPVAARDKSVKELFAQADQKPAAGAASQSPAPEPKHLEPPGEGRVAATAASTLSARALFYGEEPSRADTGSMAKEQEQAMKPLTESAAQANRLGRPLEAHPPPGKAAGAVAQLKSLGLRYSFVVRGADGQEREVDVTTASTGTEQIFLTMETNQDAYLQVWKIGASSPPQLQWPEKETGQVSLKLSAGQRLRVALPMGRERVTFTARLSRIPFGPITKLDTAMFNRSSPSQIQESGAAHEQATYIVNRDPSTAAQITVDITLDR